MFLNSVLKFMVQVFLLSALTDGKGKYNKIRFYLWIWKISFSKIYD